MICTKVKSDLWLGQGQKHEKLRRYMTQYIILHLRFEFEVKSNDLFKGQKGL
jgi:hypothetical protein